MPTSDYCECWQWRETHTAFACKIMDSGVNAAYLHPRKPHFYKGSNAVSTHRF